jgi:hypothetical protein
MKSVSNHCFIRYNGLYYKLHELVQQTVSKGIIIDIPSIFRNKNKYIYKTTLLNFRIYQHRQIQTPSSFRLIRKQISFTNNYKNKNMNV